MNKYVLDIRITEGSPTENKAVSKNISNPESGGYANNRNFKGVAGKAALAGLGMQIFRYEASIIDVRQGNTDAQQKNDFALSALGTIAAVGGAFAVNPFVGLVALAGAGFGLLKNVDTYNYEKRWETIGLAQERMRAGASYNRSRGGRGAY